MNRNEQIEQRLRAVDAPEAPATLGERIKNQIPEDLGSAAPAEAPAGARWWQIAAAMILMIGGGWFAWTWTREPYFPSSSETIERIASTRSPAAARRTPQASPDAAPVDSTTGARPESVPSAGSARATPRPDEAGADRPLRFDDVARGSESASPRTTTRVYRVGDQIVAREEKDAEPLAVRPENVEVTAAPVSSQAAVQSVEGASAGVSGGVLGGVKTQKAEASSSMSNMARRERRIQALAPPGVPPPPPSTGGTHEPNDQPYGDVFFKPYGTNPFIATEDDRLSTFGLDVDTGSYGVARRYLADGHLPPAEAIRVEEFLNSFRYGDRAPVRDDFAIYSDAAPWPFPRGEGYHALRFGIRAREVSAANRKPATLIFTVDVSGSMAREDRLGLVRQALQILIGQLDERDRVGLVVYGSSGEILLEPTADHDVIRRAIDRLTPGGSTNAEEGLVLAYRLANRYYRRGEINRVILCSDGVANVGRTGPGSILESIGEGARRGIELTTVGFGMGNYNDVLMEQLADRGNGHYAYVDTLAEARKVFVENLTGTLQTIARDAKVQVEFEPSVVARYRLIGYENRDIADERFRDDRVDAGEIGAGHAVTALYEIKLERNLPRNARVATLRLRYKDVDNGDRVREIEHAVYARDLRSEWSEAPRALRLATLAATFGEVLKGSYWAKEVDPDALARRIDALAREMRSADVDELARLARRAAGMAEE